MSIRDPSLGEPDDIADDNSSYVLAESVPTGLLFQFDLMTVLLWTAVIAMHATALRDAHIRDVEHLLHALAFGAIFLVPASTCIPSLASRLRQKNGHRFELASRIWLIVRMSAYSMVSLMLATIGFESEWKGSKGFHWLYYTLDYKIGMTLWPLYAIGVATFTYGICAADRAVRKPIYLVVSATLSLISIWYAFAVLQLNFTQGERWFWIVPGSVGICYFLYALLLLKNRRYSLHEIAKPFHLFFGWIIGLVVSIGVKYPMAVQFYAALPDEPPDRCFIVTAASRGHHGFVGAWYDAGERRTLNQQLLTFWAFERWLMDNAPRVQIALRFVYNRIAPSIAQRVVYRWQADLIYIMLKPLEWCARVITRSF